MKLFEIQSAVKGWKRLADAYSRGESGIEAKILNHLHYGNHFTVTAEEIEQWSKDLEGDALPIINAYIGIHECKLTFFLIDSKSDNDRNFDRILVKEFNREMPESVNDTYFTGPPSGIKLDSAMARNFMWNMLSDSWLKRRQLEGFQLFQLIAIPFADFKELDLKKSDSCLSFFGLRNQAEKDSDTPNYQVELITIGKVGLDWISPIAENYSTPRPPFTIVGSDDFPNFLSVCDAFA